MTLINVFYILTFLILVVFRHAYKIDHTYTYEYETSVYGLSVVNSNETGIDLNEKEFKEISLKKINLDCIQYSISAQVALFNLRYDNENENGEDKDEEDFLFEMNLTTGKIVQRHDPNSNSHKHKYDKREQKELKQTNKEPLIDIFNLNFNLNELKVKQEVRMYKFLTQTLLI